MITAQVIKLIDFISIKKILTLLVNYTCSFLLRRFTVSEGVCAEQQIKRSSGRKIDINGVSSDLEQVSYELLYLSCNLVAIAWVQSLFKSLVCTLTLSMEVAISYAEKRVSLRQSSVEVVL